MLKGAHGTPRMLISRWVQAWVAFPQPPQVAYDLARSTAHRKPTAFWKTTTVSANLDSAQQEKKIAGLPAAKRQREHWPTPKPHPCKCFWQSPVVLVWGASLTAIAATTGMTKKASCVGPHVRSSGSAQPAHF